MEDDTRERIRDDFVMASWYAFDGVSRFLREEQVMTSGKVNPYDTTFGQVEASYIAVLEEARGGLESLLRPDFLNPKMIPAGAPEMLDLVRGAHDSAVAGRKERLVREMREDLLKFFPETGSVEVEDPETGDRIIRTEEPHPGEIFKFVRAAYEVYGDLLGEV